MSFDVPATVPELLATHAAGSPQRPALGLIRAGQLSWLYWGELAAKVSRLAEALVAAGVTRGERVVQVSENRLEWILADLAILAVGGVHVPLHGSQSPEELSQQITTADARIIFTSSTFCTKVTEVLPAHRTHICYDPQPDATNLESFLGNAVSGHAESSFESARPGPSNLATILFTSGTTGSPRGVMLSHANLVTNARATIEAVAAESEETRLCFLPLSHIYARTCDFYTWLCRGTRLVLAESRETIFRDCQVARPTVINGVPYFYQKVAQHLHENGMCDEPSALREFFGGQVLRCFCGGAAVPPETEDFFARRDLPLLSGYGQTEASPVISATSLENYRPGTVGRPLPGVEVKISAEGEVLTRGPHVMQGYWQDEPATQDAIVDGWLHTGDLGELDSAGNLRIIGRRKEILVLSTGKNVSPLQVEQRLAGSPLIEAVCVVGDGRKCLAALVVPNPAALKAFVRQEKLWIWSRRRAVTHPRVLGYFRQEIDRLLADASSEQQIGMFAILDRDFSLELGEKTPKLSLCRNDIERNFRRQIDALYQSPGGIPAARAIHSAPSQ